MNRSHRIVAAKDVTASEDLYVLIDFLNRALKEKDVVLGLAKSRNDGKYTVTVYRTDACAPN